MPFAHSPLNMVNVSSTNVRSDLRTVGRGCGSPCTPPFQRSKAIICLVCHASLTKNDEAKDHLMAHEDRGQLPNEFWKMCFRWCEYCGYHTIQKSNLEQHARTSHASLLCSSQAPGANVFMTDVSASPTSDSPFCGPAYTISTPSPVGQAYSPIPALIPTAQDAQHVGDYRIHSESMSSSFEFSPQLADPEILGRLCGTTSSLQPPYEHCQAHIRPTEYSEDNADWCRF